MVNQVVGLDIGRRYVKAYDGRQMISFSSYVGEGRDRKLMTDYGSDSFDVIFKNQRSFVGGLAYHESEYFRAMMTDDKAHEDTLLLALTALCKVGISVCTVVTGLPVKNHTERNKQAIRELLQGRHTIEMVGGGTRHIHITRVEVAAEGGGAFFAAPRDGLVRTLDGGSKTFNAVTMYNRMFNDRDSWTLVGPDGNSFGFETNKDLDEVQLIKRVVGDLSKRWGSDDLVFTTGGKADRLAELIRPYFKNAQPNSVHGMFDNAIGFYNAGRAI
ncbi:ParM/StbA family protein [Paenibacillus shunpengii]|uniref:ParM/StbA family protein n=1 Tax=Paenibacillus shunpengii TaxID=2054424 RepID=A0ABW5SWH7_9BACL